MLATINASSQQSEGISNHNQSDNIFLHISIGTNLSKTVFITYSVYTYAERFLTKLRVNIL